MSIHYTSLLIAVAFSGISVLVAAFTSWMNTHKERFLIYGVVGLGLISVAIGLMSLRNGRYDVYTLLGPFSVLLVGLSFVYASARAFLHKPSFWPPILVGAASIIAIAVPFTTGYLGLGNIALNTSGGMILILCGLEYLEAREDKRSATLANATLYILTGISFLLCTGSVIADGEWVAYPIVDNWADNLNALMCLVGISGIGALTLTLHFARSARLHRAEANTDQLTGVLNRRALFARFPEAESVPGTPVLLFDLDHFKQINDQLGHAQGDATLTRFARILRIHQGENGVAARIGGEEFCMVLPGLSRPAAREVADRIRNAFAGMAIPSGRENAVATVSIGMAVGGEDEPFYSVLSRADAALYKAKRAGRNTVKQSELSMAA